MAPRAAPPHLKVQNAPSSLPSRYLGGDTVIVNHYTNTDKLIPAIPGFKTSAGKCRFSPVLS
jgi:hypothetical protein